MAKNIVREEWGYVMKMAIGWIEKNNIDYQLASDLFAATLRQRYLSKQYALLDPEDE